LSGGVPFDGGAEGFEFEEGIEVRRYGVGVEVGAKLANGAYDFCWVREEGTQREIFDACADRECGWEK